MRGGSGRWPHRFEAAWIRENVSPRSALGAHIRLHRTIQTGYDERGLPKFRVPAGRRILEVD